ncbi:zinc metalloproteinase nas-4 [Teleopsis dalmanni]|uniref:zinc metalloproteinase nas-4 n=1 Tax=Teleopsis dalmanni TaxID=139649 RepID=UPI0018CDF41D|nr:zinc metalloproteinase nas-4 [Teleopsis dalmanni]
MDKLFKILFLVLPIFWHMSCYTFARPMVDDDDDTEVIEIISNDIDEGNTSLIDLSFYGNALYGTPDSKATGELVANYTPDASSVNPEELGSYLEGDILVPTEANSAFTKNGVTSLSSRWPNGVVPFEVGGQFSARDLATIEYAIEEYHKRTCIRFIPRTNQKDYLSIVNGNSGCWSSVGRVGGKQEVNLQSPGCLTKRGTAMHELMHALGFLHEQNRQERDSFVSIQYQNIQANAMPNFEKAAKTMAYGVPYDYGSVMHYSSNAFSNNGQPTIIAMQSGGSNLMGQRDGFSAFDIEKLNKMYNCGAVAAGGQSSAQTAANNQIINSFIGGLINGLGLAEEKADETLKN